jgi:DNA-binding protein Fis
MNALLYSQNAFSNLSLKDLSKIAQSSFDISLIFNPAGLIQNFYSGNANLNKRLGSNIIGKNCNDITTGDSRQKLLALLKEASVSKLTKFRPLTLCSINKGDSLSMLCSAIKGAGDGNIVMLGRVIHDPLRLKDIPPAVEKKIIQKFVERDMLALDAMDIIQDGFVLCTPEGMILKTNRIFRKLSKTSNEGFLLGSSIRQYLLTDVEKLEKILLTLKNKSGCQSFISSMEDKSKKVKLVDISVVSIMKPKRCIGLFIRVLNSRRTSNTNIKNKLVRSFEELSLLVGKKELKDIVGESTDFIEQLCIKAALGLTKDNRVAAAQMLGLSRQSLYIKLKKYNILDLNIDLH